MMGNQVCRAVRCNILKEEVVSKFYCKLVVPGLVADCLYSSTGFLCLSQGLASVGPKVRTGAGTARTVSAVTGW